MKKSAVLVVLGLLVLSTAAFAKDSGFAIGAEAAAENASGWGGRVVFHIPSEPLYFGLGGFSDSRGLSLDATADYWFTRGRLTGIVNYYVGLGGYLAVSSSSEISLGARLPLGLQIWPLKREVLEIFLEIAPAWIPVTLGEVKIINFALQPAIGFRIWL